MSKVEWIELAALTAAVGVIVFLVVVFSGTEMDEPTYEVQTEERFRKLEHLLSVAEDEAQILRRLTLAGGSEDTRSSAYAFMAAKYFATMSALAAGQVSPSDAAIVVADAVAEDTQLSGMWELVITNQATGRVFENLLWAKLWLFMTSSLSPALDG